MNIYDDISDASNIKAGADNWTGTLCLLEVVVAVVAAPFTLGGSLLIALAVVPPTAALGAIATNTKRSVELQRLQAEILAEQTEKLMRLQ